MLLVLILVLVIVGGCLMFAPSARSLGVGRVAGLIAVLLIALMVAFGILLDRLN